MENKRIEFATLAQGFVDHLAQRVSAIEQLQGEPEPLTASILGTFGEGAPEKTKLEELSKVNTEISNLGINENSHTEFTLPILSKKNDQFGSYVKNYISSLADEADLKKSYLEKAKEITEWIQATIPYLQERGFDNTLAGAQEKSADFNKYKTGKKAEVSAVKPELERLFNNISVVLKKNKRPDFSPPQGLSLQVIKFSNIL